MYSDNYAKRNSLFFFTKGLRVAFLLLIAVSFLASCSGSKKITKARPVKTTKKAPTVVKKKGSSEQALRGQLIRTASKYKGIKYKSGGNSPRGFDCSGFTSYVCGQHDILLSRSSSSQSKQGLEISIAKAKPGDLLFFGRNGRKGAIQHVGLVHTNGSGGLHMIHSSSSKGIIVTNVSTSSYWKPKLLYARRIVQLKK